MARIASATGVPCATSTSTWRSLDTISSGGVSLLAHRDPPIGSHEPYCRADHSNGSGSVDESRRVERVEVVAHHALVTGGRVGRHVVEHVHRTAARHLAGFDVDELPARHVQGDE